MGKLLPWCSISTPPVYASFSQESILFYPKTLSRFNHKGIWASNFLKRQKVEVCQIMTRLVEVVAHPRVKVVSHGCPVLCTPVSTRPCGAHFSDILGWFSLTSSSPMRTGDIIDQVGVVTGDPLLNWPGLVGQCAGVRVPSAVVQASMTSQMCLWDNRDCANILPNMLVPIALHIDYGAPLPIDYGAR